MKGVNKQPYLDIRTYASNLTKTCLFPCFSFQSNSFSSKRVCTETRFETEAQGNNSSMSCSQEPLIANALGIEVRLKCYL